MNTILITAVIVLIILFIGLIFWTQSKRSKFSSQDLKRFKKHWNKILKETHSNPKGAILEADKLLDEALKLKGFHGSLGEKMKKANSIFSNRNGIWDAHKLRNRIAHELNVNISKQETETAIRQFKQALRDLGLQL